MFKSYTYQREEVVPDDPWEDADNSTWNYLNDWETLDQEFNNPIEQYNEYYQR